jgi:hypothetical protein
MKTFKNPRAQPAALLIPLRHTGIGGCRRRSPANACANLVFSPVCPLLPSMTCRPNWSMTKFSQFHRLCHRVRALCDLVPHPGQHSVQPHHLRNGRRTWTLPATLWLALRCPSNGVRSLGSVIGSHEWCVDARRWLYMLNVKPPYGA